ncbi:MAG: (2Fe-2S)-binding protein [Parcubacteria group bacterium]|nr:(2Fe-2S)-binding protein [Parcubacteria group bacterium]
MSTTWKLDDIPEYPKLEQNLQADVVIVGGGLAGLWSFYLLSKAGKKVVLLECERIGQWTTLVTTAFITQDIDTELAQLITMFGERKARLIWRSGGDAIRLIEKVMNEEGIECDFKRESVYLYADSDEEYAGLEEEAELMKKFGSKIELQKHVKTGFEHSGVLELKEQAIYHPLKFLKGLAEAGVQAGGRIFELTEVTTIEGDGPITVETKDKFVVEADDCVIATYEPFGNPQGHLKKGMYTSYVYELSLPADAIPDGMYLDQKNPYHYFRVEKINASRSRVIVGGEDHREELTFEETQSFNALKEFIKHKFRDIKCTVEKRWSGPILEPSDGIPLIGQTDPHRYVATAFSGNGMTYSPISATIIADGILGKRNEYTAVYDPKRSILRKPLLYKARDYAEEFFGGAIKNLFKK